MSFLTYIFIIKERVYDPRAFNILIELKIKSIIMKDKQCIFIRTQLCVVCVRVIFGELNINLFMNLI